MRILTRYRTQIIVALIVLLGTVTTAYLKYLYNRRKDTTSYQGRVIDKVSMAGIQGASVSVVNTGIPSNGYTDHDGVFHLDLPGKPDSVRLRILAEGYEPFDHLVSLTKDNFEDVRLNRNVPSPPATPSPQPPPPTGKPYKASPRRTGGENSNLLERRGQAINALHNTNHL